MKALVSLALLGVALVGCSSSDSSGVSPGRQTQAAASCVTSGASYVVQMRERSGGTCGSVPDGVLNTGTDGTVQAPSGCTGEIRNEGCDVYLTEYRCPGKAGGSVTQNGKVSWAPDGSRGAGVVHFEIELDANSCLSSYDVTYTRQ